MQSAYTAGSTTGNLTAD